MTRVAKPVTAETLVTNRVTAPDGVRTVNGMPVPTPGQLCLLCGRHVPMKAADRMRRYRQRLAAKVKPDSDGEGYG
jgi:hypothetical protein